MPDGMIIIELAIIVKETEYTQYYILLLYVHVTLLNL